MKLGEILPGNISEYEPNHPKVLFWRILTHTTVSDTPLFPYIDLELVDQYDNVTKTLTPTCVNDMTVKAEGLDQSAVTFTWQVGK